jgi:glutathione-regulated potassium-efflux system ancillary protein KefG
MSIFTMNSKYNLMKNRILILFAHPRYERSASNIQLVRQIPALPSITFHDLYENYPDFNINVTREKDLLLSNDIIIWHHPFYWYSSPPLLKQWIDLVFEFGWAYGPGGTALQGKLVFNCITVGGPRSAYDKKGYNRFTIKELLTPFEQTASLCRMTYLPPFAMHGTHRISAEEKNMTAGLYGILLERLASGDFSPAELEKYAYMNDWIQELTDKKTAK